MKRTQNIALIFIVLMALMAACQSGEEVDESNAIAQSGETEEAAAVPATEQATATAVPIIQETATKKPTLPPPPTSTNVPTSTPLPPTETPFIPTNTPVPTETPAPTNTPAPTAPPQPAAPTAVPANPTLGQDILPNGDFEGGHYNQSGIPELQLPNGWRLEWEEGSTGLGNAEWDVYVRPETRVLSTNFLPPAEHPLYIYDGVHTIKVFKGYGAISARLMQDITLEPGVYRMTINVFPDLYVGVENGQKVWSPDAASGQIKFLAYNSSGGSGWITPIFGQRNTLTHDFTVSEPTIVTVGVWVKGPFAIANNGWFMDDWSLQRIE